MREKSFTCCIESWRLWATFIESNADENLGQGQSTRSSIWYSSTVRRAVSTFDLELHVMTAVDRYGDSGPPFQSLTDFARSTVVMATQWTKWEVMIAREEITFELNARNSVKYWTRTGKQASKFWSQYGITTLRSSEVRNLSDRIAITFSLHQVVIHFVISFLLQPSSLDKKRAINISWVLWKENNNK